MTAEKKFKSFAEHQNTINLNQKRDIFMARYYFSKHAVSRMKERNISEENVAEALTHGKVFNAKEGLYKAKYSTFDDEYVVVFSKEKNMIVTVAYSSRSKGFQKDGVCSRNRFKQYMKAIRKAEFNDYCREEFRKCNVRFGAEFSF